MHKNANTSNNVLYFKTMKAAREVTERMIKTKVEYTSNTIFYLLIRNKIFIKV